MESFQEKVTALIPVRAGSVRIKNKNLRLIGGETLLARKIRILKECSNVGDIIVASDSEKMLSIAEAMGVKTFKMEEKYASSTVVLNDAIHYLYSNMPGEHVMWVHVTSPLVKKETFEESIRTYFKKLKEGHDSLTTYTAIREYLWDENGPINYSRGHHPRSQDLKPYKKLNFAILIIPKKVAIEKKYYIGENPYWFETSIEESVDIDNEIDLFMANALLVRESMRDVYLGDGS